MIQAADMHAMPPISAIDSAVSLRSAGHAGNRRLGRVGAEEKGFFAAVCGYGARCLSGRWYLRGWPTGRLRRPVGQPRKCK